MGESRLWFRLGGSCGQEERQHKGDYAWVSMCRGEQSRRRNERLLVHTKEASLHQDKATTPDIVPLSHREQRSEVKSPCDARVSALKERGRERRGGGVKQGYSEEKQKGVRGGDAKRGGL